MMLILLLTAYCLPLAVFAHEGEDHGDGKTTAPTASANKPSITTAERNLKTDNGNFNIRVVRSPSDPRTGEVVQFGLLVSEKVEGGFSASGNAPLENAKLTVNIQKLDGSTVAENIAVKAEKEGKFIVDYAIVGSCYIKNNFVVATPSKSKINYKFTFFFSFNSDVFRDS